MQDGTEQGWDPDVERTIESIRRGVAQAERGELLDVPFEDVWAACGGGVIAAPEQQADGRTVYDTASNHLFDSWKDADLYRAIDLPENGEPGPAQEREIEEYVEELRRRYADRAAREQREFDLRLKHGISYPVGRLPGETYGR